MNAQKPEKLDRFSGWIIVTSNLKKMIDNPLPFHVLYNGPRNGSQTRRGETMNNALYARVSKGKGQDIASQKPELESWAAARPKTETTKWYIDKHTGKIMDRPGFNRLMDDVRAGKVKTIVIWRLDRLGRTVSGLSALFTELKSLKVNLISLKDGLDLSTPAGTLMANVLASMAQFETEIRAERIHAGLAVAKANGKRLGRKPSADGKGPRIKVTIEQEAIVKRLKAEGQGVSAIARTTGLSRPTVYSIIGQGALV
jgi:DNA invertase Pin-like site-specific DNA recombinase